MVARKLVQLFVVLLMASIMFNSSHSNAQQDIGVYIDGKKINFEVQPFIEDGTTLVPFRAIFEELEMEVSWFQESKIVVGEKEGLIIRLIVGSKTASVNDDFVQLTVAPKIVNGSTMIPLRFVSEATGNDVKWHNDTRTITITTPTHMDEKLVEGEVIYKSGYKYKGQVVEDKPNGEGKLYNSQGELVYVSGFKDGLFHGKGKVMRDGIVVLEGQFSNDKLNGEGTVYSYDGVIVEQGIYKDGKLVSESQQQASTTSNPPVVFNHSGLKEGMILKTRIEEDVLDIPELKLIATNESDKDIIAFEFTTSFVDAFDRPVYRTGTNSTVFIGIVQNTLLKNKNTPPTYLDSVKKTGASNSNVGEYSFSLVLYKTAVDINKKYAMLTSEDIRVTMVKFSDGTVWKAAQ